MEKVTTFEELKARVQATKDEVTKAVQALIDAMPDGVMVDDVTVYFEYVYAEDEDTCGCRKRIGSSVDNVRIDVNLIGV